MSWGTGATLLSALCLLGACDGGGGTRAGAQPEPFELHDVVSTRLEALGRQIEAANVEALAEGLAEEVDGMVTMLASASDARIREVPLATITEDIGPPAIPRLVAALGRGERPMPERLAAAELLAALDHPEATEALLQQVEHAPEALVRRWCAWFLMSTSQDWVVPRVLLRMKYEQDHETFVWLAAALAHFDNYSGVQALVNMADGGATDALRAQAQGQLDALAESVGRPAVEICAAWSSIDAESLPQPTPSPELVREVWRLISELSSDHFQLRGVDDSRYVLSHLGPWAALEVAEALADEDFHVRLHSSQVLERMGARATRSGAALRRALAEPQLAPSAAEALGRVGYPPALAALVARTGPEHPHDLRVAAVRALGRLGLGDATGTLRGRFDDSAEPDDLRLAAATALVLLDRGDDVARWLTALLATPDGDADGAEIALETWLVRESERGRPLFSQTLAEWRGLAGPPGVIPTFEQARERHAERARALAARLDELL